MGLLASNIPGSATRHNSLLRSLRNITIIVFNTLLLATGSVAVKLLVDIPPWQVPTIRNAVQIPPALFVYYYFYYFSTTNTNYRHHHPISLEILRRNGLKMIARGVIGAFVSISFFLALQNLPLGDTAVIIFSNPVIVAILAHFILHERLTAAVGVSIVLTVGGLVLVSQPEFIFRPQALDAKNKSSHENHFIGVLFAVLTALLLSASTILSRTLRSEPPSLAVFYGAAVGGFICGGISLLTNTWVYIDAWSTWGVIGVICAVGVVSQYLIMVSFRLERASVVSLVMTLEIVWSYCAQVLVFHEIPGWLNIIGAMLVLTSVMVIILFDQVFEAFFCRLSSSRRAINEKDDVRDDVDNGLYRQPPAVLDIPSGTSDSDKQPLLQNHVGTKVRSIGYL